MINILLYYSENKLNNYYQPLKKRLFGMKIVSPEIYIFFVKHLKKTFLFVEDILVEYH